MFRKTDRAYELQALEQELWDAEEEDAEEEYEDEEDYEPDEEEELENAFYGEKTHRYAKGSTRRFDDKDFFEDGFEDQDVLYRRDYKKAKRKQRRKKLGLLLLALAELAAFAALILWWASWTK